MTEILTIDELSSWLKMTKRQVYELTRGRTRARQDHPLPMLRINGNTRFRRHDVESWLDTLAKEKV
jgi:hypothetical protein